jgi:hypothetical protein
LVPRQHSKTLHRRAQESPRRSKTLHRQSKTLHRRAQEPPRRSKSCTGRLGNSTAFENTARARSGGALKCIAQGRLRSPMRVHTHSYRLVSFILFFGRGWASAFPTRHATHAYRLVSFILFFGGGWASALPTHLALTRMRMRAMTHKRTHIMQACVLYSLLRRGMGIGFTNPPCTHSHAFQCYDAQAHAYTGLCPLFSSSEGDGHRLYQPALHSLARICML